MQMMNYSVVFQGGYQMIFTSRLANSAAAAKGQCATDGYIHFFKEDLPRCMQKSNQYVIPVKNLNSE
jgi:hypothetical protein